VESGQNPAVLTPHVFSILTALSVQRPGDTVQDRQAAGHCAQSLGQPRHAQHPDGISLRGRRAPS